MAVTRLPLLAGDNIPSMANTIRKIKNNWQTIYSKLYLLKTLLQNYGKQTY